MVREQIWSNTDPFLQFANTPLPTTEEIDHRKTNGIAQGGKPGSGDVNRRRFKIC